jgi:hypothetical protein
MSMESGLGGGENPLDKHEKKIFKAALINADELLKSQSVDIADARMTESKKDRSRNIFARTAIRIWKHNLAQEWYRQREIKRVREEILKNNNLYGGEQDFDPDKKTNSKAVHDEAMSAIVSRFTSEYEEDMLKDEERDSKKDRSDQEKGSQIREVEADIKTLIKRYAGSNMSKESFEEEKKRILSRCDPESASDKSLYADNLFSIATEVKEAVTHGAKLKELDFEVELTLGKAKGSLSSEAHQSGFDKTVEKFQNSSVGKYIANEPTALLIAAGLYETSKKMLHSAVRSKAVQWGTFGLAALASGYISSRKESARLERERAQHMRERAKGMEFKEPDMKRRQEMEKNAYEARSATDIIESLSEDLENVQNGKVGEEELNGIMGRLANLESRIKLNDQKKVDLISYDKWNTVEKDRMMMDLKRAQLKVAIRKGLAEEKLKLATKENFDTYLSQLTDVEKTQLLGGEHGMDRKDEIFKKMKHKKVTRVFINSAIASATIGTLFQEGRALFDPSQDGIIEGSIKSLGHHTEHLKENSTALEYFRRWTAGEAPRMPRGDLHEVLIGKTAVQLPKGIDLVPNSDSTFNLVRNGEVISGHIPMNLDAQGNLSEATKEALAKSDIHSGFALLGSKTTEHIHQSADDYLKQHASGMHKVHRELWYDNDTPHPFDQNELKEYWGGVNNTGIDAKGNYVFNIANMSSEGSYHGQFAADPQSGELKMLFSLSRGTQHQVFEVPIGADGNAIIDPKSEIGKLMFETHNGHAVFTGQFAEVAQSMGHAADGGENVRILATHMGPGKETMDDIIIKDTTVPKVILDIPAKNTYDVPFVIPIRPRRPLEKGEYKKNAVVEENRHIEDSLRKETFRDGVGYEEIPAGSFRSPTEKSKIGEVKYSQEKGFSGNEITVSKKTDYIGGIYGLNLATADTRLKQAVTHKNPEVLIFEDDRSKKSETMKNMKTLQKRYPKIKFIYVPLPKNVSKMFEKGAKSYMNKRLESIMSASKISTSVAHNLYAEKAVKTVAIEKPLGEISPAEWDRFVDKEEVSDARLNDLVRKLKGGEKFTAKEQAIYAEKSEIIERMLRKAA